MSYQPASSLASKRWMYMKLRFLKSSCLSSSSIIHPKLCYLTNGIRSFPTPTLLKHVRQGIQGCPYYLRFFSSSIKMSRFECFGLGCCYFVNVCISLCFIQGNNTIVHFYYIFRERTLVFWFIFFWCNDRCCFKINKILNYRR